MMPEPDVDAVKAEVCKLERKMTSRCGGGGRWGGGTWPGLMPGPAVAGRPAARGGGGLTTRAAAGAPPLKARPLPEPAPGPARSFPNVRWGGNDDK
jgi:hypothetical protein